MIDFNIRPKTEQERIVEILMQLPRDDREELLSLCGLYPKFHLTNQKDFHSMMRDQK